MADSLSGLGSVTIWKPEAEWKKEVPYNFEISRNLLEFEGTATEQEVFSEEKPNRLSFNMICGNKAEEFSLLQKFAELKGRLGRFWLMCPENLFTIKGNHTLGQTQIKIELNLWEHRSYDRIYLLLKNGDLITRRVTNVSTNEGLQEMNLTIDLALDRNLAVNDIRLFSLLYLCRLENDTLELDYESKALSQTKLDFIELVKEYASL